MKGDLA